MTTSHRSEIFAFADDVVERDARRDPIFATDQVSPPTTMNYRTSLLRERANTLKTREHSSSSCRAGGSRRH